MKSLRRALPLLAVLVLAGARLALAGEHGHGGEEHHEVHFWADMTANFVNSAILFTMLYFALRKPLGDYFKNRSDDVRKAIDAASKARTDAELLLKEAKERVASAETEIGTLRAKFESESQAERDYMIKEAEKTAARIIADAKSMAEGERERAIVALKAEASRLAAELAEKKVRAEINAGDQDRLAKEFVGKLGRVSG